MSHGGNGDFESRIAQIEAVAAAVAKFSSPELQIAAFNYLLADVPESSQERGFTEHDLPGDEAEAEVVVADSPKASGDGNGAGATTGGSGRKKPPSKKQSLTFDKSLNFYSASGELGKTLKDFVDAHPAANVIQKAVVVVYWLSKELGVSEITVDHVYSAFKTLEWPIPSNLLNTLQQAGSKNFLDTKKSTDVKMTTHGENLVEFQLVPKADA